MAIIALSMKLNVSEKASPLTSTLIILCFTVRTESHRCSFKSGSADETRERRRVRDLKLNSVTRSKLNTTSEKCYAGC